MVESNKRVTALIDVSPKSELVFNYVIKKANVSFISIKNISNGVIAFKVKTNKPQSYLVKPHEGVLPQDQSTEVEITMQPTDYNPQTSVIDDKFLIVAMLLPPNPNPTQIPVLWKSTSAEEQHQVKLKVALKIEGALGSSSVSGRSSVTSKEQNAVPENPKPEGRSSLNAGAGKNSTDMNESTTLYKSTLPTIEEKPTQPIEVLPKPQIEVATKPIIKPTDQIRKASAVSEKSTEERISQLERDLLEVKGERDRLKSDLEQSNIKRKSQEQFVFQLSEEKNKFENELNMLKNSTFKQKKEGGSGDSKEGTKPIELWHMIIVAIICLILGAFLSR